MEDLGDVSEDFMKVYKETRKGFGEVIDKFKQNFEGYGENTVYGHIDNF